MKFWTWFYNTNVKKVWIKYFQSWNNFTVNRELFLAFLFRKRRQRTTWIFWKVILETRRHTRPRFRLKNCENFFYDVFAKIPWNQHSTNLYFIVTLFSRNFFLIGGKFRKKKEPWHKFCHFHTNSCKMLQSCNRFVIYNTILTWVCFLGIFRLRL